MNGPMNGQAYRGEDYAYEWKKPVIKDLQKTDGPDFEWTQFGSLHDFPEAMERGSIHKDDHHWRLVAILITRLPALKDLVYQPDQQFPPCLLETLHRYRPRCRVHLQSFDPRHLPEDSIDPYEFKLLTSPWLYSIMIIYNPPRKVARSIPFDHAKAFLRVLGLAPRLKDVYWNDITGHLVSRDRWTGPLRNKFPQENGPDHLPLAAWTCLRIRCHSVLLKDTTLYEWAEHIDFSVLERLELPKVRGGEVFDNWSMNLSFPSLQSLVLDLGETHTPEFYDSALHFLRGLRPLSELKLKGWHTLVSVYSLVDQHGSSLRKLALSDNWKCHNCLSESDILQLGRHCPFLEDLQITIMRLMVILRRWLYIEP